MAKSIIINKHGGPEVLELVDVKISPPGPNHIRIKNLAIGLNFIDTYHRSGLYKLKLPSGKILKGEERKIFEVERIKLDVKLAELKDYKR